MQKQHIRVRKLKIGILGTRGIPNHYGGFEQFAQYLSLGLVERGHEVYVYNSDRHLYKEKEWNGVNIIHCRDLEYKYGTFGQFFYDLNCNRDAAKRDFDVLLHLGYTSDSIWYWRWPGNTINMVNMDGMEWKRSKYNKPTQRFLRWAESLAAKHAQVLIADSPRIQEYLLTTYSKKATYIPYGAEVFTDIDDSVPERYKIAPYQYFLLVARMEPENNIEMIIKGYLASNQPHPLLVIGNINKFGAQLKEQYQHPNIRFSDPVYDQHELNNLRYFSAKYFHGHSVGGTNPSLLEAMACGCNIAAHNNVFNKAVLSDEADYFSSPEDIANIINYALSASLIAGRKEANINKINTVYGLEKNISDYERLMLSACGEKTMILKPTIAESV
jgi:glycosyltransferase involved in cell wall biosynthesis